MTKADDSPQVTIPRQMLQDVLAEHLTKSVFDNIEQRDELIRSLVRSVLDSKEYDHDKMTYMEKFIRKGIANKVQEIAQEWVDEHRDLIKTQVEAALADGMVANIVAELSTAIAGRIGRGY